MRSESLELRTEAVKNAKIFLGHFVAASEGSASQVAPLPLCNKFYLSKD